MSNGNQLLNTSLEFPAPLKGGLLNEMPINHNFLSPLNFRFILKRAPATEFFIQKINLPGFKLGVPQFPNPFVTIPEPGEHLAYNPLTITFKVDEDLKNYLEIHKWMQALGKPKNFEEYREVAVDVPQISGYGVKSDISLILMTNIKNPSFSINFVDAFPVLLGDIQFDTREEDIQYLTATATFKYTYYDIESLNIEVVEGVTQPPLPPQPNYALSPDNEQIVTEDGEFVVFQ